MDSWYDNYLGVVILIRVFQGSIKKGMKVRFMARNSVYQVEQVGVFTPKQIATDSLSAGEMGFIITGIKQVADCNVGDTITDDKRPAEKALAGFKPNVPVVFCGFYPSDSSEFEMLRDSLGKLRLNDASFEYEPETSTALGLGFRCGFLGLLHLEIIQERLDRQYNVDLITTAPSVVYKLEMNNGKEVDLHNPIDLPDPTHIKVISEPWIKATIMVPDDYLGNVLSLCEEKRGQQIELTYVRRAGDDGL